MDKPITMIIEELKVGIVTEINKSKLPMWVVRDILRDFETQAERIADEQAKADREAWEREEDEE